MVRALFAHSFSSFFFLGGGGKVGLGRKAEAKGGNGGEWRGMAGIWGYGDMEGDCGLWIVGYRLCDKKRDDEMMRYGEWGYRIWGYLKGGGGRGIGDI